MSLLPAAAAAIPAALLLWLAHRLWRRAHPLTATASEWRERMPALGTQKPPQSILDENGRRVWDKHKGAFVTSPATWKPDAVMTAHAPIAVVKKRTVTL